MTKKSVPNGMDLGSLESNLDLTNMSSTVELTGIVYNIKKDKSGIEKVSPEDENTKVHPTSDLEALMHVIKSSLGTGILALPDGFKNAGMVVGLVGTIVIGILCAHCTYVMVKCSQVLCRRLNKPFLGFIETVESAFLHCANQRLSKYAGFIKKSVEAFMFFTYYGVNTVYIIIVASSLQNVMEIHFHWGYDIRIYILMTAIPIYLIGIVRNMKYLVPFSALANVLLACGLCLTFYFICQDLPPISSRQYVAPISKLPLFFSTVLFGMEGIGTMLPIENSMKNPKHFLGCPGVLTIAMTLVVTLFMLIGFFGYLKFGDAALASMTLNLPDDWLAETVKVSVALAILFSYGLQLTASMDVVWKRIQHRFKPENEEKAYYIVRSLMIVGTVLLAVAVPQLAPVISLIGAVGFSMCGFFYPAIVETVICWDTGLGPGNWILWKNSILVVVAIIAAVAGSVASISDIIHAYSL